MKVTKIETLKSAIDQSVNFVMTGDFPGALECRYVRRSPDYFVAYLSSQSSCRQACRMCWLTATGQVDAQDVPLSLIMRQADTIMQHYESEPQVKTVHFSFMARGEPLASQVILEEGDTVVEFLNALGLSYGLRPRTMLSTIMPRSLGDKSLLDIFQHAGQAVHLYYSIYSVDPAFRRKWLPNALPVSEALAKLVEWQKHTNKIVKLHWALIKGENDSATDFVQLAETVAEAGLRVDMNLVMFNPINEKMGEEAHESRYAYAAQLLQKWLPEARIETIERVGQDVAGSCGMFTGAKKPDATSCGDDCEECYPK